MLINRSRLLYIALVVLSIPFNAYGVSPESARYNEEGVQALNKGDYHYAIDRFQRALDSAPGNEIILKNLSNAHNNYGYTLMEKGQLHNAIDNFKSSVRYNPDNEYAYVDIGHAYYKMSRLKEAEKSFMKAYELNPKIEGLKEYLDKVRNEMRSEKDLNKMETRHFVILAEEGTDINSIDDIKIALEDAYMRIGAFIDHYSRNKTVVILYPDEAYRDAVKGKPYWAHAIYDGKIRIPADRTLYTIGFMKKMLFHEYSHAITREVSNKKAPMWLSEGMACYAESMVEAKDKNYFTGLINSESFISFSELPERYEDIKSPYMANLVYREFFLVLSFIVDRFSARSVKNLMRGFSSGMDTEKVILNELKMDIYEFDRMFKEYVYKKLGI